MLYKKHLNLEDRKNLPLNGPSNYRICENKVLTRAIEVNAVTQCNLSCKGCSHCSPIAENKIYNPDQLKRDLMILSKFLKTEFVRVVGGEPLLHPELSIFLKNIKESKISEKTCLVTNGLLLDKINEECLKYIDKIEVSLYPLSARMKEKIINAAEKLSNNDIKVRLLSYSDFRQPLCQNISDNIELIQQIYETCQIAHNWRCITIDNNKIYRCPQSMIFNNNNNSSSDILYIDDINNYIELLEFLENNNYLEACKKCLGSVGKKFEHAQIKRQEWISQLPLTPEEGVDMQYKEELSKTLIYKSDCMERNRLN